MVKTFLQASHFLFYEDQLEAFFNYMYTKENEKPPLIWHIALLFNIILSYMCQNNYAPQMWHMYPI